MNKLITIKNKDTGRTTRVPINIYDAMNKVGAEKDRFKHLFCVPKKLWKRQQRDENRIRSKRKDKPFGSALMDRMAKQYGTKMGVAKKK